MLLCGKVRNKAKKIDSGGGGAPLQVIPRNRQCPNVASENNVRIMFDESIYIRDSIQYMS